MKRRSPPRRISLSPRTYVYRGSLVALLTFSFPSHRNGHPCVSIRLQKSEPSETTGACILLGNSDRSQPSQTANADWTKLECCSDTSLLCYSRLIPSCNRPHVFSCRLYSCINAACFAPSDTRLNYRRIGFLWDGDSDKCMHSECTFTRLTPIEAAAGERVIFDSDP